MYPTLSLHLNLSHVCAYHLHLLFVVLLSFSEYMHVQDNLETPVDVWEGRDLNLTP
jgi:hypothetical protein